MQSVEDVENMLILAAKVDKSLPRVKAQDAKALWPDIVLTEAEKKALRLMTREGEPDFSPSQADIDLWYRVCTEWVKPFAGDEKKREQWAVIWLKACGCPSKVIEKKLAISRTKVWYIYDRGMERLVNYLGVQSGTSSYHYRPELVGAYPQGKVGGFSRINLLREWLAELEGKK